MAPRRLTVIGLLCGSLCALPARGDVGDPQVRTDHPWYPGELACSTCERLFATQADLFEQVVGIRPTTEEHKALAAWLWRNTHYWHGEEGTEDLWGQGFTRGPDLRTREYWTGLFAHGFGLCGTTHAQWVAEMEALLGHNRGRVVGVAGHNSFEVFLTGGPYGAGKWVLLDHDVSTVVFNKNGTALLSAREVRDDWRHLTDQRYAPERQHGWLVCGLHPDDGSVYRNYGATEYLAGGNDGGRSYARCEAHLVYRVSGHDATKVTFSWTDDRGPHQAAHTFAVTGRPGNGEAAWVVPTGQAVQTRWIEFEPVVPR